MSPAFGCTGPERQAEPRLPAHLYRCDARGGLFIGHGAHDSQLRRRFMEAYSLYGNMLNFF
jgi:hypothetical protein